MTTDTQRSLKKVERAVIVPTFELVYSDQEIKAFESSIKDLLNKTLPLVDGEAREMLYARIYQDIEKIQNHQDLELMHKYISLLY